MRAFDGAGISVVLGDLDGTMQWVNTAFAHRLGHEPEQLAGMSADVLMSESERARARERRRRSRAGQLTEFRYDVRLRTVDGASVPFEVMRLVLTNGAGDPARTLSIALDRTELEGHRRELAELGRQLTSLVDDMPIGMLRWDRDDTIVLARGRALHAMGHDPDALIGTSISTVLDQQPGVEGRIVALQAEGGGEFRELLRHDGEFIDLVVRIDDPSGPSGGGGMAVGLVVSDQERAKRRTESLAVLGREAAARGGDVDGVLDVIARTISRQLAAVGIVSLFEDATGATALAVHHADPGFIERAQVMLDARPLRPDGPVISRALRSGRAIVADGPTVEEYRLDGDEAIGERMVTAITVDGEPVGVAVAASHVAEGRSFDAADRAFLDSLADRAGAAIGRAMLVSSREARERQQAAVARLGELALTDRGFAELARDCVELVYDVLGEPCLVYLEDGHPDGQLVIAARGFPNELVNRHRSSRESGSVLGALLAQPDPVICDDMDADDRFPRVGHSELFRATAGVGINTRAGPVGALCALSPTVARFTPVDASLLSSMANVLSAAWEAERASEELRHNATHDALTGLPNRALLDDRLDLALAGIDGGRVGVAICDLDNFKIVNESRGHDVGDQVLEHVARRLHEIVRPGDTVARFGGDEFVIVCPDIDDEAEMIGIARRVTDALRAPLDLPTGRVFASASVGIALGNPASTAQDLIRDADSALHRAKEQGRDRWEFFDETLRARALYRLETETALRRALAEDQFVLHYQPITSLTSGRLVGVEALIRWDHPERGLLSPGDFMPIAEQTGLIVDIGTWVLEEAARQTAAWTLAGLWDGRSTSVNVAAAQMDESLPVKVHNAVRAAGIDASALAIEITETVLLRDTKAAEEVLRGLRSLGVQASVDDFGTGYSSLAYLAELSVDSLKIDRSFVQGLVTTDAGRAITEAVIHLASALGLRSIAEGVETVEQVEALRHLGADEMQGFLIAHPEPAESVTERARTSS